MLKILCKSYFPFVAIVKILSFYCVYMFQKHEEFLWFSPNTDQSEKQEGGQIWLLKGTASHLCILVMVVFHTSIHQ